MRVAVVGGGIAGLSAAYDLAEADSGLEVSLFEPGPLGGKLTTEEFAGHAVDLGPDAFITRMPHAVELCQRLGLRSELVAPVATQAMLWTGGRLRALPEGLMLGVPARLGPVLRSGVLSPWGSLRAGLDLVLPKALPTERDCTVAELVGSRFGQEVLDRLVDPLIGGIHAGRTDELSVAATVPQLQAAYRRAKPSLLMALRTDRGAPGTHGELAPLFLAPRLGMGRLVERLVEELSARRVEIAARSVTGLRRHGSSLSLVGNNGPERSARPGSPERSAPQGSPERSARPEGSCSEPLGTFDGVVLAVPPATAASLLDSLSTVAASSFKAVPAASVTMVTMAYPAEKIDVTGEISGFLVPRRDGRLITACSFGSHKWPHWSDPAISVLRVSAGRSGDDRADRLDDQVLVQQVVQELSDALGCRLGAPLEQRVVRWRGAFPQYLVGHLARIDRAEAALAAELPQLVLAGAGLRGSGIPACIASAHKAAVSLLSVLCGA